MSTRLPRVTERFCTCRGESHGTCTALGLTQTDVSTLMCGNCGYIFCEHAGPGACPFCGSVPLTEGAAPPLMQRMFAAAVPKAKSGVAMPKTMIAGPVLDHAFDSSTILGAAARGLTPATAPASAAATPAEAVLSKAEAARDALLANVSVSSGIIDDNKLAGGAEAAAAEAASLTQFFADNDDLGDELRDEPIYCNTRE